MSATLADPVCLSMSGAWSPRGLLPGVAECDREVVDARRAVERCSRALTRANARLVDAHRAKDRALEREEHLAAAGSRGHEDEE